MQRYYVIPSDFRLALDPATIVHGNALLGGTPFRLVRLNGAQKAAVERWRAGGFVGEDGALARALVHANLAQPMPPGDVDARGYVATPGDVDARGYVATPGDVDARGYVATPGDVPARGYVATRSYVATDVTVVIPT